MFNNLTAVFIGLITGSTMSVAVSCAWCVLHLPARIQHKLRALSPASCAMAVVAGLLLAALRMGLRFSLHLPVWTACAAFVFAGMFVGMLASALGELLEVVPVLAHRFHLGPISRKAAWAITLGKALGAVIACLVVTL